MLETLLRWAARALAGILERYADPELDAKLRAFNEKVAAQEQRVKDAEELAKQSEAAYLESVKERNKWDLLLAESQEKENESRARLAASQTRVKEIEDETKKLKNIIDSRSDAEKVRLDL